MLRTIPHYKSGVSIIPGGGIQFLDLDLNLSIFSKLTFAFNELPMADASDTYDLPRYSRSALVMFVLSELIN